jgi:hypothetical protein
VHTFAGAAQAREAAPSLAGWFAGWGRAAPAVAPAAAAGARDDPRASSAATGAATKLDAGDEPAGPVLMVGHADVPTDGARVYRDAHRVVLKRAVPCDGAVVHACVRLHDHPAGPADGSGWELCAYELAAGAMGEAGRYLVQASKRAVRVDPGQLGATQRLAVAQPLAVRLG